MFEKRAMQMMINPHTVQNKHILKTLWNPPFHTLVQAYVFVLKWKDWTWPSFHLFIFHFVILLIDPTVIFKYKNVLKILNVLKIFFSIDNGLLLLLDVNNYLIFHIVYSIICLLFVCLFICFIWIKKRYL